MIFQPEAVERLLQQNRAAEAIELTGSAAEAGDAQALFTLARWRLIGAPLPRDLEEARMLLRRAVEIGHVDAALMEVALTANGSGGPTNWQAARRLLETAALSDPIAAEQLALLNRFDISADGSPTALPPHEIMCEAPRVLRFRQFLTPAECGAIAQSVSDILAPAMVADPKSGKLIAHPVRTSSGAVVGPTRENLVLRAINLRIAAASGTNVEQGEPLSVLRYTPGQEYRPHHDALPHASNQRIATAIIYLNDGYEGGETRFLNNGVEITPRAGDMILFRNVTPEGAIDPDSRHAGLAVRRGTKWIATRWIRERAFDPWTGD